MNEQNIILIEPNKTFAAEFQLMAREFEAAGDNRYRPALDDFSAYLKKAADDARGVNLKPDRVPQSEYWLIDDGRIVARSSLRHRLNAALEIEGGHIGYDVRPSERKKGYGTLILKLTLEKAKDLGLKKVLVTCDTENVGSAKIIEKNAGKLTTYDISEKSGNQISRYWISLK